MQYILDSILQYYKYCLTYTIYTMYYIQYLNYLFIFFFLFGVLYLLKIYRITEIVKVFSEFLNQLWFIHLPPFAIILFLNVFLSFFNNLQSHIR
jgi:hypothetical protein